MGELVADAEHALALVGADPRAALEQADAVVARVPRARDRDEVRALATAHRAAGLALRQMADLDVADKRLRRAISVAERADRPELAAEARMSLAFVLMDRGRLRAALTTVDNASATLVGPAAARVRAMRALVLQRSGRTREALADYADALPVLQRAGDTVWEARLRNNRAPLFAVGGDTQSALADLSRAHECYLELGLDSVAAEARWNMGCIVGMGGDIPGALELFDLADSEEAHLDLAHVAQDRADVLLRAGLAAEATDQARTAVISSERHGQESLEAEARLLLALCLLVGSRPDLEAAAQDAARARSMFARQDRPEWAALADYVIVKVALLARPTVADLDRTVRVASVLRDVGWEAYAADLRVTAGRVAVDTGDLPRARTLLGPLASLHQVSRLDVRSRAWYARGLLAEATGDSRRARSLLRKAWDVLETQRSLLGATELRAGAATHAQAVVDSGARLAAADGAPSVFFDWAELGRCAALRFPPAVPPQDSELAHALTRLRWAASADEQTRLAGEHDRGLASARTREERRVVRLTRIQSGTRPGLVPVRAADVRPRLDGRVFVHYAVVGGRVWASVLTGRRTTLHDLTTVAALASPLESVAFGLRRLVTGFGTDAGRARAGELARGAARELDALLLAPLRRDVGDATLVVCPSGALTTVPWSLLDSCHGRAVSVAPSATVWCRASDLASAAGRGVLAVAGPGLPGARLEAEQVAAVRSDATVLVGDAATGEAVLRCAEPVGTLHVAAHGRLRVDNPLFSSLELADGPLTGYDLEGLSHVPGTVVLSACSSGAGRTLVADETLGLAWTFLGVGAAHVVAPLIPIPDSATLPIMIELHRALEEGVPAPVALARSRAGSDADDPAAAGVSAAFISYGA